MVLILRKGLLKLGLIAGIFALNSLQGCCCGGDKKEPPVMQSVAVSPALPKTLDDLVCDATAFHPQGKDTEVSYQWHNISDPETILSETETLSNLNTSKNNEYICTAIAVDDEWQYSGPMTASAFVLNSKPVINENSFSYSPSEPTTVNDISVSVEARDDDNDSVEIIHDWYLGDELIYTGNSITSDLTEKGNIDIVMTPYDGEEYGSAVTRTITISNTPPVISGITITPLNPTIDDNLVCSADISDVDEDVLDMGFSWYNSNNDLVVSGQTLSSTLTQEDTYTCVITADDGEIETQASLSRDVVYIAPPNNAPVMQSVSIDNTTPRTNQILNASYSAEDADGDTITYLVEWYNGTTSVGTSDNLDLSVSGNGDKGDIISLCVTPYDGKEHGNEMCNTVTVQNSSPAVILSAGKLWGYAGYDVDLGDVSDDDGLSDIVLYEVDGNPVSSFDNVSFSLPGFYNPVLYCEDDSGASDTRTISDGVVIMPYISLDDMLKTVDEYQNLYGQTDWESASWNYWQNFVQTDPSHPQKLKDFESENSYTVSNVHVKKYGCATIPDMCGRVIYEVNCTDCQNDTMPTFFEVDITETQADNIISLMNP